MRPEDQETWTLFSVQAPIALELACRRLPEADSSLLIPVARVIDFTFGFENKISAMELDAKYPVGNPVYPDRAILWLALNWALRQEEIPIHFFSDAPFSELEQAYKKTVWPKADQLFDEISMPLQEWIHTRFPHYVAMEKIQEFLQPFFRWEKTLVLLRQ